MATDWFPALRPSSFIILGKGVIALPRLTLHNCIGDPDRTVLKLHRTPVAYFHSSDPQCPRTIPFVPSPRKQEQEQELRAATPLSRSCSASQPASQRQRNPFCRIQTEINVKQNPIQFQFQSHPRAHCWAVMARGGKGRATSEGI